MPDPSPAASDDVAVLVPAAGEGRRLGGQRKQFRTLGDRPLLLQALRPFDRHPAVDHLVVAAPPTHVDAVTDRLRADGLSALSAVVGGGDTREASVRHALRAVPGSVEVVLVHDAVRPFVQAQEITAVVRATREHGAAALALPVADTLRHATDETFGDTVSRDGLYRMQTPQGFRRAWLEAAHRDAARADADADGPTATDDVGLVQRTGREVHLVPGSRRNFKVTTSGDWELAQDLWAGQARGADDPSA